MADVLVIAGAYIMGSREAGKLHRRAEIVGSLTDGGWGVAFPDAEGFRHPVVLYDGIKNLLMIAILLLIRKPRPPRGVILAHFVLWYGFLRIGVDLFREYRAGFFGLPPGQEFNIFMTGCGFFLLFWFYRKGRACPQPSELFTLGKRSLDASRGWVWMRRLALIGLVLFPAIIPSDWTQDVPERYGKRHPGISYSLMYPRIPELQQQ